MSGSNFLIAGDACESSDGDLIAQRVRLPVGQKPPGDDGRNCGWRVVSVYGPEGGQTVEWWRVAQRYEVESLA